MAAMRAANWGLTAEVAAAAMVAELALKGFFCCSSFCSFCCFPMKQSSGLCTVQALWCSHQLKVYFPTCFPSLASPSLGGIFFQCSSFFFFFDDLLSPSSPLPAMALSLGSSLNWPFKVLISAVIARCERVTVPLIENPLSKRSLPLRCFKGENIIITFIITYLWQFFQNGKISTYSFVLCSFQFHKEKDLFR